MFQRFDSCPKSWPINHGFPDIHEYFFFEHFKGLIYKKADTSGWRMTQPTNLNSPVLGLLKLCLTHRHQHDNSPTWRKLEVELEWVLVNGTPHSIQDVHGRFFFCVPQHAPHRVPTADWQNRAILCDPQNNPQCALVNVMKRKMNYGVGVTRGNCQTEGGSTFLLSFLFLGFCELLLCNSLIWYSDHRNRHKYCVF